MRGLIMRSAVAGFALLLSVSIADANNRWLAIDGDTIVVPADEIVSIISNLDLHVRIRGIDTPELKCHCAFECIAARQAKFYTQQALAEAQTIEVMNVDWDKYGGRVDADVIIDGSSIADRLIRSGLAHPYYGGTRKGWCQ